MEEYDRIVALLEDVLEELKFVGQRLAELSETIEGHAKGSHSCQRRGRLEYRIKPDESDLTTFDAAIGDW